MGRVSAGVEKYLRDLDIILLAQAMNNDDFSTGGVILQNICASILKTKSRSDFMKLKSLSCAPKKNIGTLNQILLGAVKSEPYVAKGKKRSSTHSSHSKSDNSEKKQRTRKSKSRA